jgi:hypothetical protein
MVAAAAHATRARSPQLGLTGARRQRRADAAASTVRYQRPQQRHPRRSHALPTLRPRAGQTSAKGRRRQRCQATNPKRRQRCCRRQRCTQERCPPQLRTQSRLLKSRTRLCQGHKTGVPAPCAVKRLGKRSCTVPQLAASRWAVDGASARGGACQRRARRRPTEAAQARGCCGAAPGERHSCRKASSRRENAHLRLAATRGEAAGSGGAQGSAAASMA